jgi:site-specific recombinase XerD
MKKENVGTTHPASHDLIEGHIAAFVAELKAAGYARNTLSAKRATLRRFLSWRARRKRTSPELAESEIGEFLKRSPQADRRRRSVASRALYGFLEYLRRHSIVLTCAPERPETVSSALVKRYADFLRNEKGLAELSLKVYLPVAEDLLQYSQKEHSIRLVRRLDASLLRAFLFDRAQDRSSECVRLLATSLRSFLRFLHAEGEIANDLTAAIPTVRRWTQPDIPKKLTAAEVNRVLKTPNLKTATGRRDYAILLLLARLGLRSSEILSIEVGDLRWRTGEIVIRGKGNREDLLPLPTDVGSAMVSYLRRDRGARPTQRVFLRSIAPRVPLTGPASIGHIVRRAMTKAGVERPMQIAAHLFRHTLASRMLQHGANLREISEVLRHRAHISTEIYAKIDIGALQEVARPWPVQGGGR